MSDNEAGPSTPAKGAAADPHTMPQSDVDMFLACLRNSSGGVLSVNYEGVAKELGYTNVRSVGNRITQIKKKYGINITKGLEAFMLDDGTLPIVTPKETKAKAPTPKPNKVTKKTPVKPKKEPKPKAAKTPAKKAKKSAEKVEIDSDEDMKDIPKVESDSEEVEMKAEPIKSEDEA